MSWQRQDPLKQAGTALIKAEHSFKLLAIDTSAVAFQLMLPLDIYHVLLIGTSAFAF